MEGRHYLAANQQAKMAVENVHVPEPVMHVAAGVANINWVMSAS